MLWFGLTFRRDATEVPFYAFYESLDRQQAFFPQRVTFASVQSVKFASIAD